jgi:hypothetical protein
MPGTEQTVQHIVLLSQKDFHASALSASEHVQLASVGLLLCQRRQLVFCAKTAGLLCFRRHQREQLALFVR